MARDDDDILMGTEVLRSRESVDSDGDGVSDVQERLDGTDAGDAADFVPTDPERIDSSLGGIDPQAGLDQAVLERMTTFDPTANLPAGMTIGAPLAGLTNPDGSALTLGPDHDGVGGDALLAGQLGANSPLNMLRDPTQGIAATSAPTPAGGGFTDGTSGSPSGGASFSGNGGVAPAGADLSFRAPNSDLVSAPKGGDDLMSLTTPKGTVKTTTTTDLGDGWTKETRSSTDTKTGKSTTYEEVKNPAGETTATKTIVVDANGNKTETVHHEPDKLTDPDSDTGGTPTQEVIDRAVVVAGGDSTPVQGDLVAPQIEGEAPPPQHGVLVTDGGDEIDGIDGLGATQTLRGAPDAPVINVINPDSEFVRPGGEQPGNTSLSSSAQAATAATNDGAPGDNSGGISLVGSGGGGGISSTLSTEGDGSEESVPRHGDGVTVIDERSPGSDDTGQFGGDPEHAPPTTEWFDRSGGIVDTSSTQLTDSDGDGVSDAQELLMGTDPFGTAVHVPTDPERVDVTLGGIDPQAGLDPAVLERMTTFDPTANLPAGMTIGTPLAGLTNPDGTALKVGPDHDGVGSDALLAGQVGANSPVDMLRDPTQGVAVTTSGPSAPGGGFTDGTSGGSSSGGTSSIASGTGGVAPAGADLSFRAPDSSLVSDDADGGIKFTEHPIDYIANLISPTSGGGGTTGTDGGTKVVRPAGDTAIVEKRETVYKPSLYQTDPDSGTGGTPTQEVIDRAVVVAGGDTTPVQSDLAPPQIEGDTPPPRHGDLVTDGGDGIDGIDGLGATQTLRGAPDAPVINVINPDSEFDRPGGEQPGNTSLSSSAQAATAATNDGVPGDNSGGISLVGSGGGGGISSTVSTDGDDILGSAPSTEDALVDAPSARDFGDLNSEAPTSDVRDFGDADAGASAGDAFATADLDDTAALRPDSVMGEVSFDAPFNDATSLAGSDGSDGFDQPLQLAADDDGPEESVPFGGPMDDGFD